MRWRAYIKVFNDHRGAGVKYERKPGMLLYSVVEYYPEDDIFKLLR